MKRTTAAVATAIVSAASAFAQNTQMMDQMTQSNLHTESPWTVGLGVALPLGVGGEVNYRISPKFSVSVGAYAASFNRDFDDEGFKKYVAEEVAAGEEVGDPEGSDKYNVDLKMNGFPVAVNYHPFESGFHITAGVIVNNTKGTASRSGEYTGLNAAGEKETFRDHID